MEISDIDYQCLVKQIRGNILDWYPFKEDDSILEICKKESININQTNKKIQHIDSIEQLNEINVNDKYDYIIFIENINKIENYVSIIKNLLKENGKIIIITNNALSIKRICQKEDQSDLLNYNEIKNLLNNNGFGFFKFYYVLPDYETANVIFTDSLLPNEQTINRNITFYSQNNIIGNMENEIFKNMVSKNRTLFKLLVNSFFIEASLKDFDDNKISFVSFSNMRKEKFRIKTIIRGEKVYKTSSNKLALGHIEQIKSNIDIIKKLGINTIDSYDEKGVISLYQKENETVDKILINMIKKQKEQEAKELIFNYYEDLKEKLEIVNNDCSNVFNKYDIEYKTADIQNLKFVKYGLWDLIFQNAFYIDKKIYFYDQEWIENNIPVEFVLYRALKYCQELNKLINISELYTKLNITKSNIELFNELDNILQENTRSKLSWRINSNAINLDRLKDKYLFDINLLKNQNEQMNTDFVKLLNQKDARIKLLEDTIDSTNKTLEETTNKLSIMENSKSWKITKPLRDLKNKKRRIK